MRQSVGEILRAWAWVFGYETKCGTKSGFLDHACCLWNLVRLDGFGIVCEFIDWTWLVFVVIEVGIGGTFQRRIVSLSGV